LISVSAPLLLTRLTMRARINFCNSTLCVVYFSIYWLHYEENLQVSISADKKLTDLFKYTPVAVRLRFYTEESLQ